MKWSSILVLGALAFVVNACEKHPASQLPPEHASAFGDHAWPPKAGAAHADAHGHAPAAAPHAPAPAAPATAPERPAAATPNLFPVKK